MRFLWYELEPVTHMHYTKLNQDLSLSDVGVLKGEEKVVWKELTARLLVMIGMVLQGPYFGGIEYSLLLNGSLLRGNSKTGK